MNVETLQPPSWLEDNSIRVGRDAPIPLDLIEMGLPRDLRAKVLAIERCPPIELGAGRVVLTTGEEKGSGPFYLDMRGGREEKGSGPFYLDMRGGRV